jgi:hypothetical protein
MKPRFSIRDLLWLTVVVALAVGWWLDRERLKRGFGIFDLMKTPTNESTGLAIAVDDENLYRVVYPRHSEGGVAEAYRRSDGAVLWKTQLKAIGHIMHVGYSNQIAITASSKGLTVEGHETLGIYFEVLDKNTGNLISSNVFKRDFSKMEDYKQE